MHELNDLSLQLNPDQRRIVEHHTGPALVIAGAGSGKTRVITQRVAHLIQSGTPASAIMLLTFTNKAAREMTARAETSLGKNSMQQKILSGTFHSMANRFLRRHAKMLGYEHNFSILDASDSRDLIKTAAADTVGKAGRHFPKAAVLQNVFSLAFNRNCTAEMVLERSYPTREFQLAQMLLADFPHLEEHSEELLAILRRFREKKRGSQVMDFDDLLENWLELLLKNGEGLPLCRQVQFILVDEYQDTNHVQANILECLAKPHWNLMVVGDDAQSIYSWRGADFRNILEFPERFNAQVYHLEQNYRSTPEILDAANESINHNTRQFEKQLYSKLPPGCKPMLHQLWNMQEEAEVVLDNLLRLRDEDIPLESMSVLYRNHVQSASLQVSLTHAGIPFQVHSGMKFFEQAHIKDITAFLKVIYNPLDEIAWMRLLKMLTGIGATTANRIFLVFQSQQAVRLSEENDALQKLIPRKSRNDWNSLRECLRELLDENISPAEMISTVYKNFYRAVMYSEFENAKLRENDIHYLVEFAGNYRSLESFLNELSLVGSSIITEQEEQNDERDLLTLTTIHQAKGLEWDVVFLIGLTEGLFPHQRNIESPEKLEEERRLFYVAMTRARRHLIITAPMLSSAYNGRINARSRFIYELPDDLVETVIHARDENYTQETGSSAQFYF